MKNLAVPNEATLARILKSVGLMRTAIGRILGKSATEMSQYLYHNKKG